MLTQQTNDVHAGGQDFQAGDEITAPAPGSLQCAECNYLVPIAAVDAIPRCPACGGSRFTRARMFEHPTMDAEAIAVADGEPSWLDEAREMADAGPHLAWHDGETRVLALKPGWARIGRSPSADIQLDDATVSRRHALVVCTEDGTLRALDDRSLNGLFVNGERVEWAPLSDGDELEVGCYRVVVLT